MDNNGHGQTLHPTRIDIAANVRSKLVTILNHTLAHTLDLKTQVKQAHWNVKGMEFYTLHELFDGMAGELEEFVDSFAERVTALGGTAMGTARMAVSVSTLPDYPVDALDGSDHVTALADRYAIYAKLVRDGIAQADELGDADTADLYTEVSREIDKRLWFLDAHLKVPTLTLKLPMTTKADPSATQQKSASAKTSASTTAKSSSTAAKSTAPSTGTTVTASKSSTTAKAPKSTSKTTNAAKSASKPRAATTKTSTGKTTADQKTPKSDKSEANGATPKLGSRAKGGRTGK